MLTYVSKQFVFAFVVKNNIDNYISQTSISSLQTCCISISGDHTT